MDLPEAPEPVRTTDNNYTSEDVDKQKDINSEKLRCAVDSDYAGDTSHRKSVTGIIFKLAGGAVFYKMKFQEMIAMSSTKAEFTAASEAGKYILYVWSILEEIGIPQTDATVLYEDNQGALLMANAKQPTKRTHHMDVKHFKLQEWVEHDLIIMERINTSDNYADVFTKAQGRCLFYRHMDYVMGKVKPYYVTNATP